MVNEAVLAGIRLVLSDVDGVLTDSGVYYSARGEEMKRFSIRDGMGVERLRRAGIESGIITGELSESVKRRAEKLRIDEVHLGVKDKGARVGEIAARRGIPLSNMAFLGDDVNDLEILAKVGLSACPADAFEEVKGRVAIVCRANGGHGAYRELAELILRAKTSL